MSNNVPISIQTSMLAGHVTILVVWIKSPGYRMMSIVMWGDGKKRRRMNVVWVGWGGCGWVVG